MLYIVLQLLNYALLCSYYCLVLPSWCMGAKQKNQSISQYLLAMSTGRADHWHGQQLAKDGQQHNALVTIKHQQKRHALAWCAAGTVQ
jgi:hypothetical protein